MNNLYSTTKADEDLKYNKEYIRSKIDDLSLFQRYINDIKLKKPICSPLRKDESPSFSLFVTSDGNVLYKDFATGDSGDVFKFLKELWNCISYKQTYKQIVDELPNEIHIQQIRKQARVKQDKKEKPMELTIGIKRQKFTKEDLLYWNRFGITEQTLNKFNVNSIQYYTKYTNEYKALGGKYSFTDPLFSYKVKDKFKIYRPLTKYKKNKWNGNLTKDCIFGYEQLPKKGDCLIITKALKDIMVLYELGFQAVAPPAESTELYIDSVKELIDRFSNIYILFDNDATGIKFANKYESKYKFKNISIPEKYGVKDISDFYNKFGKVKTLKFLRNEIQ